MPFAYELAWTDPNYQRLKNSVEAYERSYAETHALVARHEAQIQDFQSWHQLLDNTLNQHIPDDTENHHGQQFIANVRGTLNNLVENAIGQHRRTKYHLGQVIVELTNTREQLRRYPSGFQGEQRVTKADLTRALTGLPNLKPGSIATGYAPYGVPFVRWVFTGLLMRPDRNPYAWLRGLGAGSIPSFPLQDVQVSLRLTDGTVHLAPVRGQRDQAPFSWDNQNRVHPHILGNDEPCLGDFAGPFREALHELEWVSVYTYLRLFLERAIVDDTAGAKWIRPFESTLSARNLAYTADSAYSFDEPSHGYFIVETTPGCFELHVRDSLNFFAGNLLSTTPLELRGRRFQEAATI
ncbi:hypothetical protein HW932_01695 [Allochromatium humboldtianum]|uniref:Uncharacterized protein n=1 Tax=Allochromatium humboldtianum TaxID=504901 RepID=A0A850R9M1_9GAMM|nr:hypothetical protein [Allochromatium humboldtianum]NVZ07972.1 hypothetical protein [Allochromatium humboldtianum]